MSTPAQGHEPTYGSKSWKTALLVGKQRTPDGTDKVMVVLLRDDTLQVAAFLSVEQADQLAEQLVNTVTSIRTGLVIPPKSPIEV